MNLFEREMGILCFSATWEGNGGMRITILTQTQIERAGFHARV